MSRLIFFFTIVSCFFPVAQAGASKPVSGCELGSKLRLFDSLPAKIHNPKDERLLKELFSEPLFLRDDEKFVGALVKVIQSQTEKKDTLEKIVAFIERTIPNASLARERRATALFKITNLKAELAPSTLEQVYRLLSVELAETLAGKQLPLQKLSDIDWARRIEVLSERNENLLVISELTKELDDLKRKGLYSCRIQFLLGRAYRKNRNYKESQIVLDGVADKCAGDDARDAAFLLARLAAISPSEENMKYFGEFEKKYAQHSYYDDVLIFKASALESLNRLEEAKQTLSNISKLDSASDMRFEAFFRLAFSYALEGNNGKAIEVLNEAMASKFADAMSHMEKHRVIYWRARLQLQPDIFELKKSKIPMENSKVQSELQSLADSGQQTFYSWLSKELLAEQGPIKNNDIPPVEKREIKALQISNPLLKSVLCLFENGFEDYARRFVEMIDPVEIAETERTEVSQKFNEIGLYDQAFRFANLSGAQNLMQAFPRAYEKEVTGAATQIGLPKNLVYGLMREESRFDARAVSWAGARGLLQLMPQVAKSEASSLKIKNLSDEDMFKPQINILLGAKHLKGMLNGLKHPLFAVAAYNSGFKRVKDWEDRFDRIKALDTFVENIPLPETRNYVKRVASSWITYSRLYVNDEPLFSFDLRRL